MLYTIGLHVVVNSGFKVVTVWITGISSNLECGFRIECQQVQGRLKVIGVFLGGLASILELVMVIAMEHRSSSRSSQGHLGIYYWIGFKLSTWDHN